MACTDSGVDSVPYVVVDVVDYPNKNTVQLMDLFAYFRSCHSYLQNFDAFDRKFVVAIALEVRVDVDDLPMHLSYSAIDSTLLQLFDLNGLTAGSYADYDLLFAMDASADS